MNESNLVAASSDPCIHPENSPWIDPTVDERRRILVVDDNPSIHEDFRKVLEEIEDRSSLLDIEAELFGESTASSIGIRYEISGAYQGQESLAMVERALQEQRPFDMAFVDMRMPPGWDGLQTIENLWKADPDLQIVICSAYSDYPLAEIRRRLGITDKLLILKKPFENSEVCQLAATLTEKRRLARQANLRMSELEALVEERTNELKRLATVDMLTNLLNRRGIYEAIESFPIDSGDVCVLMIDVDSFKRVNDQFGHRAGDMVLSTIGDYIRCIAREGDISGRIGGDEFVAILAGTDLETGGRLAETLRQRVADHIHEFGEHQVTLSIGLSQRGRSCELSSLIELSDRALYQAKADGRNATRVWVDDEQQGGNRA